MHKTSITVLGLILAAVLVHPAFAGDDEQVKEDEKVLQDAKQETTGDSLCEFFKKRTPVEADLKTVPELIGKLGSEDFETREKATEALMKLGPMILPLLRKEFDHPDVETRTRVRDCIEKLQSPLTIEMSAAAARLLRERKPKQAVEILLAYLPSAPSDEVENEVMLTLLALGAKDGKVQDNLAAALKDTSAPRRAAAALAMARGGDEEQKKLAAQALKDTDAAVRFRAAQGFIAAKDKTAVPVLLPLLTEAPLNLAESAEDLLMRVAGDGGPSVSLGTQADTRKKCREAWEGWSKKYYEALDLSKSDVDVAAPSPASLAKDTVRKFVEAVTKKDAGKLEKTLDEQVNIYGQIVIPRGDLVKQIKDQPGKEPEKITVGAVKSGKLADILPSETPEVKKFTEAFGKEKVQAVSLEVTEGGRTEKIVLVLRVKGGKALIAGLAPEK